MKKSPKRIKPADARPVNKSWQKNQFNKKLRREAALEIVDSQMHTCPYKVEMNGTNRDELCDCSEEETRRCAMDT